MRYTVGNLSTKQRFSWRTLRQFSANSAVKNLKEESAKSPAEIAEVGRIPTVAALPHVMRRSWEAIGKEEREMERETGIEPATSSLGSWRSTAELLPLKSAVSS